jgi:hypothetical protein
MWIVEEFSEDRDMGPSKSWWDGARWVGYTLNAAQYATREEAEAVAVGLALGLNAGNIYARPVDEPR